MGDFDQYINSVTNNEKNAYSNGDFGVNSVEDALKRAREELEKADKKFGIMPHSVTETISSQEMDPLGCYSKLDLDFTARLFQIERAGKITNPKVMEYVNKIKKSDAFQNTFTMVKNIAKENRIMARAGMYLPDENKEVNTNPKMASINEYLGKNDKTAMETRIRMYSDATFRKYCIKNGHRNPVDSQEYRDEMKKLSTIESCEKLISAMEYQVGIKSVPLEDYDNNGHLPEAEFKLLESLNLAPDQKVIDAHKDFPILDELSIEFQDVSSKIVHLGATLPQNVIRDIGEGELIQDLAQKCLNPKKKNESPEEKMEETDRSELAFQDEMDAIVADFAAATVFKQMMAIDTRYMKAPGNIWDKTIIAGKTGRELYMEHLQETGENDMNLEPGQIAEKMGMYCSKLMACAIQEGKPVEVFMPTKEGAISAPTKITSPSARKEKPFAMNLWQRFWNKFGFYKKEAALEADAQHSKAQMDYDMMVARGKVYVDNSGSTIGISKESEKELRGAMVHKYQCENEKPKPGVKPLIPLTNQQYADMGHYAYTESMAFMKAEAEKQKALKTAPKNEKPVTEKKQDAPVK